MGATSGTFRRAFTPMEETNFYQENDKLLASRPFEDHSIPKTPSISVVGNKLRVGHDTYMLDDVTTVSLESPIKRIEPVTLFKRVGLWTVFWLFVSFFAVLYGIVGLPRSFSFSDFMTIMIFIGVPFVFATLASKKDAKERYHEANLTLVQSGRPTKIFIGAFRCEPGYVSQERDLWAKHVSEATREKVYKDRVDFYNGNVRRTEQIAAAVCAALGHHFVHTDKI